MKIFATVLAFAMIATVACVPTSSNRVDTAIEMAVVKDKLGEGSVILQRLPGVSDLDSTYVACLPNGRLAIVQVYSHDKNVTLDDPILSFEKGSKFLQNKPVDEVLCMPPTTVAHATPNPNTANP